MYFYISRMVVWLLYLLNHYVLLIFFFSFFKGFAIFCGLGIHNTQMYEKASLMLARQKLNMEVCLKSLDNCYFKLFPRNRES